MKEKVSWANKEIDFNKWYWQECPISFGDLETYVRGQIASKVKYIEEIYKNYFMYSQDRQEMLDADDQSWRFNVKAPVSYMFINNQYSMVLDADIRFVVIDRTGKYKIKKEWERSIVQDILDWWDFLYTRDKNREAFNAAIFDAVSLWRWAFKITYDSEKQSISYRDSDWKQKVVNNDFVLPTIKYVPAVNIFPYWVVRSLDDARFIIERKFMSSKNIEGYYKKYWVKLKKEEIEKNWYYVDHIDYEWIKLNMPFHNTVMGRDVYEDDNYNVKNKLLEVYEVHTHDNISLYINSIYHWTFTRYWAYEWYPYRIISTKKIPWSLFSVWLWYILKPLQKAYDALLNSRMDNVHMVLNKQFLADSSLSIFGWSNQIKIKPWAINKVWNLDWIKPLDIPEVKQSGFEEVWQLFQMMQTLTWQSWPIMWHQEKVERTATWAELLKNAADRQIKWLLDSISENMWGVIKNFITMTLSNVPKKVVDKVLWKWHRLYDINIEDVLNDFDFSFEMLSMKSQSLSVERQQLLEAVHAIWWVAWPDWAPVVNIRPIMQKLLSTYWLEEDSLLSPEQTKKEFERAAEREAEAQLAWQKIMQKASWWEGGGTASWLGGLEEMMQSVSWDDWSDTTGLDSVWKI